MKTKYNFYIGLKGIQDLTYVGSDTYDEIEEARFDAYVMAFDLYEKHEGTENYPNIFQVAEINHLDYYEDDEKVADLYAEIIESLILYEVVPTHEDSIPENKLIDLCE